MTSKNTGSRLGSINLILFILAIIGLLVFLTNVTPSHRLAYLGSLVMIGLVVVLTGFMSFLHPQE